MGQKSVAWRFFYFLILFEASLTFYVDSNTFPGNSSQWNHGSGRKVIEGLSWSPWPLKTIEGYAEKSGQIQQRPLDDTDEHENWLKVLSFDKAKSLSETDKGPHNESKIIVISEKEHFEIYENNEEEEESGNELGENIFPLLNPENFFSLITTESQSGDLQRTKREAEDDQKKKRRCRCRRVMRRTGRRRRRRRRNGQQNGRRRRRQRRGRRRCVCRRRGGGGGKTDGGKDEGGGSEESGGGDEGGEEGAEGEGGDDGEGEEGEEDEESDGDEGSDEDTDEESSEEDEEEDSSAEDEKEQLISPVIPVPPGSVVVIPGQPMPPHPDKLPPPNVVPSVGGKFSSKP